MHWTYHLDLDIQSRKTAHINKHCTEKLLRLILCLVEIYSWVLFTKQYNNPMNHFSSWVIRLVFHHSIHTAVKEIFKGEKGMGKSILRETYQIKTQIIVRKPSRICYPKTISTRVIDWQIAIHTKIRQ